MRTADPEDRLATVLLALRKQKGYGFAVVAKCKGATDTFAVAALVRWLGEAGLGSGPIRLRSDSEVSIRNVAAA
eukprot:10293193-Heterocapsa_arctica.AAC.1